MKVAGFTFIRNAQKFDYPIVEAITSILPICDEFIVAIGNSEDDTMQLIQNINSTKIKIVPTQWNDALREGGAVLALETNKAKEAISKDVDWCFYIQGDEAIHEKYLPTILTAMHQHLANEKVEGLLFKYEHFFGAYNYCGNAPNWYRREIRIVRNDPTITSYKDAQGFRKQGKKLHVKLIDAYVYHYGWVKNPTHQMQKAKDFSKYWHNEEWIKQNIPDVESCDYSGIDSLKLFTGTHPQVMLPRIARQNWEFVYDVSKNKLSTKKKIRMWIEQNWGWKIGEYRNYKII